jgi:hypothetical protein
MPPHTEDVANNASMMRKIVDSSDEKLNQLRESGTDIQFFAGKERQTKQRESKHVAKRR